MAKSKSYG